MKKVKSLKKRLRSKATPEKEAVSQKPEQVHQHPLAVEFFLLGDHPEPAEASQSDKVPSEAGESIVSISSSSGLVPASSLKSAKEKKAARPKAVQKKPSPKNQVKKNLPKSLQRLSGAGLLLLALKQKHQAKLTWCTKKPGKRRLVVCECQPSQR